MTVTVIRRFPGHSPLLKPCAPNPHPSSMYYQIFIICFTRTSPTYLGKYAKPGKGDCKWTKQRISGSAFSLLPTKASLNVSIQENNYKTLTRCYHTPVMLNKYHPDTPNTCWRSSREPGSLHIFCGHVH